MKDIVQRGAAQEGFWLRAKKQTGGIGRLGRKWESPSGNLYCSTVVNDRAGDPAASTLSFVTALAVHDAIHQCLPDGVISLKWPNDILVSGAKICGILLESVGSTVVVGIGVNVAIAPQVEGKKTTSLLEEGANPRFNAADMLELLTKSFGRRLMEWREQGLGTTLINWEKLAHPRGTRLLVSISKDERMDGEYAGLASDGALRLRKKDGTLIEIRAGDVETGQ